MRRIKREGENKDYKSMAALRGMNRGGAPQTPPEVEIATREYITAMEERATLQDAHIEDRASAESVITRGSKLSGSTTSQQLNKLHSALATLMTTVSSQALAMTALTYQVATGKRDGGGGNRKRIRDKKPKEKHTCTKCKLLVWHMEEKCPEYERNTDKRWAVWKSALE